MQRIRDHRCDWPLTFGPCRASAAIGVAIANREGIIYLCEQHVPRFVDKVTQTEGGAR